MAIRQGPKEPLQKVPEGFTYSKEAREDLRDRSKTAAEELTKRIKKDEALRERVATLIKEATASKG